MDGERRKTENLVIYNTDPYYNNKSYSEIMLLLKILYGVVICVFAGFGIYFLIKSKQDEMSKDLIDFNKKSYEWNTTYRPEFVDWKLKIINENNFTINLENNYEKVHEYEDNENLYYNPLQYISNNIAPLISNIKLKKSKSDASTYSYNLTATLHLEIENTFTTKRLTLHNVDFFIRAPVMNTKQAECVKNKGLWNYEDEACYKYYMLRTLCLIVNQQNRELFIDYKQFKCNGFNKWYESFSIFPWVIPTYDPSFDDLEASNKKIGLYVATNYDPYVWAIYNGTLHFSNMAHTYNIAGIWLVACALCLIIVPLLLYFKENSENVDNSVSVNYSKDENCSSSDDSNNEENNLKLISDDQALKLSPILSKKT